MIFYRCTNGRCIYRWSVCDHVDNCGDGSDEDIHGICYGSQAVTCPEYRCSRTNRCIRFTDLYDESKGKT
jgi:low density lipoprotein-related protein 2